ncbi:MAG: hypothetical protein IKO51_10650 [Clostridia bacterium]|nr:hypothetical protein [Clostridia bacterium]
MASMRNGSQGGMDRRAQMQRVPSRQNGTAAAEAERGGSPSPLLSMARRIRDEQGVSGLRDFLSAMAPFSAPNELRSVAEGFGMDYDEIKARRGSREQDQRSTAAFQQNAPYQGGFAASPHPGGFPQGGMGFDPSFMRMMQQMQGGRRNAGIDPMQLMQLMQLVPMLQGMKNGGGGPNLAQLMKMMGG